MENTMLNLLKNKWVKNSLLVATTFCVIEGFDFLQSIKAFAQTPKADIEKVEPGSVDEDEELHGDFLGVFLDGFFRYDDYIKQELLWINYVRDRKQADIHILMTIERTAARGREYTLTFTGLEGFSAINDTLKYYTKGTDTREMTRRGILRTVEMGLIPYIAETPIAQFISIDYKGKRQPVFQEEDKWDNWVLLFDVHGSLNGEEARKSVSFEGSISAERVTPNWKISQSVRTNYSKRDFKTSDEDISAISRWHSNRGLIVKSLSKHLSAGISHSLSSSIYSNTKISFSLAPAVEYNIFPYEESTRREFRFLYRIGARKRKYIEETIYDKLEETLFYESLSATFELKELWGTVISTLEGSHYFHDLNKNRLQLYSNLSLRLFEGFSLTFSGNASMIRDQLSLPKEEATEEDVLLRIKQLATQYDYRFTIGFRYRFGSELSNIVNPRMSSGRRWY